MKYYTRRGDDGLTDLPGGGRVAKTDPRIEAYGAIDELNAHLGLLSAMTDDADERSVLETVQACLFSIGALAVTVGGRTSPGISTDAVALLEGHIDRVQSLLPPLTTFVLPGGTQAAAQCHVCRTVCRRAERRMLAVAPVCTVPDAALRYLNRLSDYLFALALKLNFIARREEKTVRVSCK